jgi:Rrf2 family nitric oxide-sensitive transcriptional repressor
MHLTRHSDYALRVLLYLATHADRPATIPEIARAYRVSPHLLVKVVRTLVTAGLVATVRGRHGGLRLARPPAAINVGAVLRRTETTWHLVECFDRRSNTCPIEPACALKGTLREAQRAFLDVLDGRTLQDLLPQPAALVRLLRRSRGGALAS